MKHIAFSKGCTRYVVLYGDRAYKIARIRPIRMVLRFFEHLIHGQVGDKLGRFDANPNRAVLKYIFFGVLSNREEWYISKHYPSPDRAEVLGIHFFGFVIVQERGAPFLSNQSPEVHPFWEMVLRHKCGNASEARAQFAVFGNAVKLIDLGRGDLDSGIFP